jgi:hypothetical protein
MDHIKKTFPEFPEVYRTFVETLRHEGALLAGSKAILHHIRERVEGAFSGANTLRDKEIEEWIGSRSAEFLIVRSTGKEDSDEVSNAGGNLSVPFVEKDIRAISLDIGRVAASYFSEKSIGQRIAARDPSLFGDVHPFVPVLVQECVGELVGREDGVIPRSGVMFVKRGVSEISVGLGHNEGIVSSGVATDTIRFTREGEPRVVVRPKFSRFRGVAKDGREVSCEPCPCTGRVVEDPALSEEITKKMQHIAYQIYDFYGKEMDVEFTVVGDQIYLLQARPLREFRPIEEPSYLEPTADFITGEMITDGGSYVRRIERAEEVIVCRTIHEAYEMYTTLSERLQRDVKGIIVQEKAPRTSHEAVFFIGQGVPILQTTEKIELEKPFYIDTQQGLIAKEGVKKEGYVCYPMPLAYSMTTSDLVKAMHMQLYEANLSRGHFIRNELQKRESKIGPPPIDRIKSLSGIRAKIELMKRGDIDDAKSAANQIIHLVWDQIHKQDITPRSRIELLMVFDNLMNILEKDPLSGEEMSLERLYTVRLIEAVLFQEGKDIIGGFSFVRSLTDIKSQRVGSYELDKPHTEETLQDLPFVKMKKMILKDDLGSAFGQMLSHLSDVPEDQKQSIKDLFLKIDSANAGTEFVNVTLANALRKYGPDDYLAFFNELNEVCEEYYKIMPALFEMKKFVLQESVNTSLWANPEYVEKNSKKIRERLALLGFFNGAIEEVYKKVSPDAKLVLVQSIREVVECYDKIIKACTGSTENYTSAKEHAANFYTLLQPYRMMTKLIREMAGARLSDRDSNYLFPVDLFEMSESQLKKQFQVSSEFDVVEILQEDIEYGIRDPQPARTLEEKFTLFHQRMLKDLQIIALKNGFNKEILPEELSSFIDQLTLDEEVLEDSRVVSIEVNKGFIGVKLEIPLRQHGALVNLRYNRLEKKINMEIAIFGGNERNRWGIIHDLAYTLSDRSLFKVEKGVVKPTSLQLSYEQISLSEDLAKSGLLTLKTLLEASFTLSGIGSDFDSEVSLLELIPQELHDPLLIKKELMRMPQAIEFVREELQTEQLVSEILSINGLALKDVALKWQRDPKMIQIALSQNPMALEFVPKELLSLEIVLFAAKINRKCLAFAPFEIRGQVMHLLENGSRAQVKTSRKQKPPLVEEEFTLPPYLQLPALDETLFKGSYPPPPPPRLPKKEIKESSIYDDFT